MTRDAAREEELIGRKLRACRLLFDGLLQELPSAIAEGRVDDWLEAARRCVDLIAHPFAEERPLLPTPPAGGAHG